MNKDELAVMIVEDDDVARAIVGAHLQSGKVTYVEFMPAKTRPQIVAALKEIEY